MGKRKITCNNSSCKHHTNGGCDTCITLDGSGKCKSFEKGFAYYFHIVWDALDNKNFIDMVEIRMNPDLKPSVLACIGEKGIRRATVIKDCAYTITTRQDRTPAQVIDRGDGRYRYLTERECWRLMGYSDEDFDRAKAVQERNGKYYKALYDQAGNSIAVPIFESIFRKIILQEVA